MKKHFVLLFLIFANLFWAGNYIFGKYVVTEMTPLQMTFSRWFLAVLLLFPIAHIVEHPNWKRVWKEWKLLLVLAVLGIIGYNFLLYQALQFTNSLNAALVNAINPAIIVLFSSFLLKEKISRWTSLGLLFSLLGVLLVLTNGKLLQIFQVDYNKGDLLMLVAILVWTFYSIIGRKMQSTPPIASTAVSALLGLIVLIPFVAASGMSYQHNSKVLIGILYMGLFPSVGSFIFWNVALRHIDASKAGIYLNLIVVFTAIISLLLGKTITVVQIIGGILVFIGVYLTSQKSSRLKKENNSVATKSI